MYKFGALGTFSQDVPVVILTEKEGLFDRMRGKVIGANEFLSKPIAHADILRVLGKYLGIVDS